MIVTKESLRRKNFSPEEFFISDTAKRLGINNYPNKGQELGILTALMSTADMMQEIRDILGHSIKINSAYRCLSLNQAVGSKSTSQHLQGLACDFVCPKFGTPKQIVKFLHSKGFIIDQAFDEGSWVHVSRKMQVDSNRMMYGNYLLDPKTKTRRFKAL